MELEYEECTEDQCIMRVQEMLQVENVFHLQVIGEGQDTQLSLSWRTIYEKKKEAKLCEKCVTKDLYYKIKGLVEKLVGKKEVVKEETLLKVEPVKVEKPEQEVRIIEREVVREVIRENVPIISRKTPTVVVLDNLNVILMNPVFDGMNWKVRITTKGSPNYTCAGLSLSESTVGGNGFCSNESFHYKVYWD